MAKNCAMEQKPGLKQAVKAEDVPGPLKQAARAAGPQRGSPGVAQGHLDTPPAPPSDWGTLRSVTFRNARKIPRIISSPEGMCSVKLKAGSRLAGTVWGFLFTFICVQTPACLLLLLNYCPLHFLRFTCTAVK